MIEMQIVRDVKQKLSVWRVRLRLELFRVRLFQIFTICIIILIYQNLQISGLIESGAHPNVGKKPYVKARYLIANIL